MLLIGTVTQGAANAFMSVALNTGLSASLNNGYKIDRIMVEYPVMEIVADGNREFALSRGAKIAMPTLADNDVLYKDKRYMIRSTLAGFAETDGIYEYIPTEDIIIIEEQLYMLYDTNAMTGAQSIFVRVDVSPVKVSTEQRIAILQTRID